MPTRELESLQQARATWEKMAQFQYYGTGNTVSDPHRALADLLARMAALECRGGVHYSDMEGGRFERGLKLVSESASHTARRWLPTHVSESILQFTTCGTTSDTTSDSTFGRPSPTTTLAQASHLVHFDKKHFSGVPIKMLSTLVQNYALAAQCARRSVEARENSVLFDALGDSPDVSIDDRVVVVRYECVYTGLCEVLHGMGYECVIAGGAVLVRSYSPPQDEQHNSENHTHNSEDLDIKREAMTPKRVVKLKRKRKQ